MGKRFRSSKLANNVRQAAISSAAAPTATATAFWLIWFDVIVIGRMAMPQYDAEGMGGGCLLIFAQLKRKRYGQAHYQRTTTATATATATFRSYSGAHNRCADMLVPVRLPASLRVCWQTVGRGSETAMASMSHINNVTLMPQPMLISWPRYTTYIP